MASNTRTNWIYPMVTPLVAAAAAVFLAGCGDSEPTMPDTNDDVVVVNVLALSFAPADTTISVGQTVRWVNQQAIFHTITPDGHAEWNEASLSASGASFEHTFSTAGVFPYFCVPHQAQGMTGVIRVQ